MIKDGQSTYFLQQNMGKQGLCVNVKDPRGLELLHKLIAEADVFVENYRPGALDKLGLGYAAALEAQPAPDLLLGVGLRPYRPGFAAAGLRADRGSAQRRHGADRPTRRDAAAAAHPAWPTCTPAPTASPRSAPRCSAG